MPLSHTVCSFIEVFLIAFSQDFWSTPSAFGLPLGVVLIILWAVSQLKQGQGNQQPEPRQPAQRTAKGPECPYCAGPITKGVVKCRHCASDIQWCGFEGKSYPIKTTDDPARVVAAKRRELEARWTKCVACGMEIHISTAREGSGRCVRCAKRA